MTPDLVLWWLKADKVGEGRVELVQLLQAHRVAVPGGPKAGHALLDALMVIASCNNPMLSTFLWSSTYSAMAPVPSSIM